MAFILPDPFKFIGNKPMAELTELKEQIISTAKENGFDTIQFTLPDSIPQAPEYLRSYLENGYHGDMDWMLENSDRRSNPKILWPEVKSVIVLGMNYGPENNPLDDLDKKNNGLISVYARGKDYHNIIKKKLKIVAGWLHRATGEEVKVFVDTAPVMEKPLAQAAGVGWQGKHSNLVSRQYGSWLFLSSIFTTADIPPDQAEKDHCGSCRKCMDICPTDAFPSPYTLDARKCIAYLTIEHKGHIGREYRESIGNRVFGCDDCLAVCPWNKYARQSSEMRFRARAETSNPPLAELLTLSDAEFRERFAGTPVKRTGRVRFLRNVLIAAGNSGKMELLPEIMTLLLDEAALVRAMAVWACSRIMPPSDFLELREKMKSKEKDENVLSEWADASGSMDRGTGAHDV